jgi:uncharacterized lipoprotein YddW (UPF0748 family)
VALGPAEYRAVWVDAFHDGIKSPAQVDRLVSDAHEANLNAIFVQVRKRGDAYYSSSLEPRPWDIFAPASFDPLGHLLRRAHAANPPIEVHAWLNTFYVGVTGTRVYYEHGAEWSDRSHDGSTAGYLDPGHPEAAAYTQKVFVDLASRYPVDGVHLDFVRYPEGGGWGYNPVSVARFNQALSRSGTPAVDDPAWSQWRRDQVTQFVRGLYRELKRLKPRLKVSAALIPWGKAPVSEEAWQQTAAYQHVFQDWFAWLKEGILDIGVPLNYNSDWSPSAATWYDQWHAWEKDHGFGRQLVVGVGGFLNYPEDTLSQIRRALAPSPRGNRAAGVAIYAYASTSVYGTDDYFADEAAAATLPRQPYAQSLDGLGLSARAAEFNRSFWRLLSQPGQYRDPVKGAVATQPVFPAPAAVPGLPG